MVKATLIGIIAVLVWSLFATTFRILEDEMGLFMAMGTVALGTGTLSLLNVLLRGQSPGSRAVFRNPFFYARWAAFSVHELSVLVAIYLVDKEHLPLVILINYLWPTAVIVCSILFAGVQITRMLAFMVGSIIVVSSLSLEIIGPHGVVAGVFEPANTLAYGIAVIGAVAWGVYSALTKRTGESTGGTSVLPLFQLTLALALPVAYFAGTSMPVHLSGARLALIVGYSVLAFIAYLSWDHGMRKGSVVILSLCADFVPWISLTIATFVLGLTVGLTTIAAAILLVVGAMITRYGTLPRATASA